MADPRRIVIDRLAAVPLRDVILLVVALAILIGLNALRIGSIEEGSRRLDSYSSYDTASGGYRAWYELLQREGISIERFEQRPSFLAGRVGTLIWAEPLPFDPRQTPNTKADIDALEEWVKAGGRLLYLGHDDAAARAGILKLPATRTVRKPPHAAAIDGSLRAVGVKRVAFETPLRWKIARKQHGRTTVLVGDALGPLAVDYPYGRGRIVAVLDESAFDNARLARADNARLAYALCVLQGGSGPLAFDEAAHGYLVPEHWWAIMPRGLLLALAVAAAGLLIAFAGAAIRLGPPIVPPRRTDASSAEFLDSLAALFERGRAAKKALADVVAATNHLLTRAFGLPGDAPAATIETHIEHPELRGDFRMLVAATESPRLDDQVFVRAVASAQRLRKEYSLRV